MGCRSCGGNSNRHAVQPPARGTNPNADLKRFAYLSPKQLEYLKKLEEQAEKDKKPGGGEGT